MKDIYNISKSNLLYKNNALKKSFNSPFIEEGEFLDHRPAINRNFSIDNFEYITDCNEELIVIGKGGYGKLYLARNKKDNKEYAIKYVSKKKMKSVGVDFSIIKREIDIHIRITHPRIIKLYSYLEDRYNFYLAMEYAPKGNLYQLIQHKKGMTEDEAFYYFIQVASAIHFLHEHGYAHRDIKPENILLDENDGIKLCDFGWCVNVEKGERTTFCGTYEYMAPEMINDEYYDKGIDIWSLGVLLYEMIHGYSPFRANHFIKDAKKAQVEIFINIKNNNYSINKNISEECVDLISKLLTTDTKKRIKIDELFMHPWIRNKEKEYFPFLRGFKDNIENNNNLINSQRRIETDININCIKSLDINIPKKEDKKIKNKCIQYNYKDIHCINSKNENIIEEADSPKHSKKKSYCFVYTKGNSKNNGVYFIQGQSATNKKKREENLTKREKEDEKEKENDKNYEFNKIILTEINQNINIKNRNKGNELSPVIQKKETDAKNNFVYSISSKRRKINLPKVVRTENKNVQNNILNLNPFKSQDIINSNIKENENENEKKGQKIDLRNYSKSKNDKKSLIRVQRQELDDYIKEQNKINVLNQKMEKIKEKQELVINKLRKIEERKRREESFKKLYDSIKSNASNENYSKNKSLKNQFSYINFRPQSEIGSYSIKKFSNENKNNNKLINIKEKIKEKRSKSFQQLIKENTFSNKNILMENKNKSKISSLINKINKNSLNNGNYNFRFFNNKGEDDIRIQEDFKRFRKMVVHLKKRHNYNINTEAHSYKSCNVEHNLREKKKIKQNYPKVYLKTSKANNSIQNIYYNTFYNCLFDNEKNNNYSNIKNYYLNNNNLNNKNKKEYKSISSEKNIFKYKNIFENTNPKKYEYPNNLNRKNELDKFSSERKNRKVYVYQPLYTEQNKLNIYLKDKNNLLNSKYLRTLSSKKEKVFNKVQ